MIGQDATGGSPSEKISQFIDTVEKWLNNKWSDFPWSLLAAEWPYQYKDVTYRNIHSSLLGECAPLR